MGKLMIKEWKLAMHPAALLFVLFGVMLLIPNYPYTVIFFYLSLGIFFICLGGRENKDVDYMLLLPLRKRDIVKARFITVATLEVLQLLIAIPFAILRSRILSAPNEAGMDANVALFGWAFVLFAVFNTIFFHCYFKNIEKVGTAFLLAAIGEFVVIALVEASVHFVPFMMHMDTMGKAYGTTKIVMLFIGLAVYICSLLVEYSRSVRRFESIDV